MSETEVRLACAALGDCEVIDLDGQEGMDALSTWAVRVRVGRRVDLEELLRQGATLGLFDPDEGTERLVRLLITDATCELGRGRDRVYGLRLSDPPWLLTRRGGYRVFVDRTTEDITTTVLKDAGIPADAIVPRLAGSYPVRPQCVQYAESEWAFLERLLADDGISTWFETTALGEHRIIFGDATASHEGLDGGATLPLLGQTGTRAGQRGFFELSWDEQVVTDKVLLRDFDVRRPDTYLDGEAGAGDLDWFAYPAFVHAIDAAKARAERRLEQLQRDKVSVEGETDCIRVMPGRLADISGAGDALFDQRMLVVHVRHRFARERRDGGVSLPYRSRATLRPIRGADGGAHPPYRPPLPRGPALEHLESAVVTGPTGEEIHVDDLGRIKLRFLWDRKGFHDDRSSQWTRCLQAPLGGAMLLPRVGWEVMAGYLDGSPDRPFVLGRLYNATAVTPYALPAAAATTSFQTWTTPKSGMTQEIKMIDDAGREELVIHASKDLSIKVGGSSKTTIDGDEDHSVGRSLTTNVLGRDKASIGGMQSLDVGKELLLSVDGANTETIGGGELVNVTGNRAILALATCVEVAGAGYVLTCNQSNVNTSGSCVRAIGGNKAIASGLGVTEQVAAARSYVCLGSRTVTAGTYAESITGGKRSKAGAVRESAAAIGVSAPSASIHAGTASIKASTKVSIAAPAVTIEVSGSLVASTLTLSGGALKTTGGVTQVSGTTSRSRGGEVGG